MKIRTGDTVAIISGKDRGKTGQVLRVLHEKNRVVVAGVNMRTKHVKKTPTRAGQKLHYEASLSVSNVMVLDPKTKKPTRIGMKTDAKGRKVRIAKSSGEVLSAVKVSKAATEKKVAPSKTSAAVDEADTVIKQEAAQQRKQPFWKRMGFGADAFDDAAEGKAPIGADDHTISKESPTMNRTSGRGS